MNIPESQYIENYSTNTTQQFADAKKLYNRFQRLGKASYEIPKLISEITKLDTDTIREIAQKYEWAKEVNFTGQIEFTSEDLIDAYRSHKRLKSENYTEAILIQHISDETGLPMYQIKKWMDQKKFG